MMKYGSNVLFAAYDEEGVVEVVEDRFERTLHFGTAAKQSSMALGDPIRLVLSYTRAMTAALLFTAGPPQRVLLAGLGGGSLVRFLLHHYPACEVEAVEYRETVYRVARRFFHLPDDPRLTVFIADAAAHLAAAPAEPAYDLMLVDAFSADGIAGAVCRRSFLDDCRRRLTPDGLFAMNLWGTDAAPNGRLLKEIGRAFGAPPLCLPVQGRDNVVALAGPAGLSPDDRLERKARILDLRLGVEFPAFLRLMRKENPARAASKA
jgi:spermidine synthase